MQGIESAFTFVDRRSLLHSWSRPRGRWLPIRVASKSLVFLFLLYQVARLSSWLPWGQAFLADVLIFGGGLALLAHEAGQRKAKLLLEDTLAIVALGLGIGLPAYWCIIGVEYLIGLATFHAFLEAAVTFAMLLGAVCSTLVLAAIFFATTSLAGLLAGTRKKTTAKYILATVLTYFPRFEQELRLATLAFQSLASHEPTRFSPRSVLHRCRTYCARVYLLLIAQIWKILVVMGPNCYLAVRERARETERSV